MEELFVCDNKEDISRADSKVLSWIGYNIGKWIYIIDAYSDIEKDIKTSSYNPFIVRFGKESSAEEIKCSVKDEVEFILVYTLSQVSKSYELLKNGGFSPIIENIIYLGMLRKTENILWDDNYIHFLFRCCLHRIGFYSSRVYCLLDVPRGAVFPHRCIGDH
jgi:hypothetical protein